MFSLRLPYFALGCALCYKCMVNDIRVVADDKEGGTGGSRPKRVLVIGGGVVGLSVAHSLITGSRGDVSVKLIDAGIPVSSSSGGSRNTELVQKNQLYLDMVLESHKKWRQLDNRSSYKIFHEIPLLEIGERDGWSHYIQLLTTNKIPFEILNAGEMSKRFLTLNFNSLTNTQNGFLSKAGVLHCENVLATLRSICVSSSRFQFLSNKSIVRIDRKSRVAVDEVGNEHTYDKLVVCAGPWTNTLLKSGNLRTFPLLVVSMSPAYFGLFDDLQNPEWFNIDSGKTPSLRIKERTLIGAYNWFSLTPHIPGGEDGCKCGVTSTPEIMGDEEFKLEGHWHNQMMTQFKDYRFLENFDPYPNPQESSLSHEGIRKYVRGIDPAKLLEYKRCLYTITPDGYPVVGQHPDDPDIVVACGFNGEGFHVSPVMGELVADCVLGRTLSQLEQQMSDCFTPERYAQI